MQAAGHLVAVVVELAAGVQHGQHDFGRRLAALVLIGRNAAAVVDDRDRAIDMDRDVDLIAEAGQRLVDGVVDDFVDEMVQPGRPGRADVHRRPFADGFEPLENLDFVGAVVFAGALSAVAVVAVRGLLRTAAARRSKRRSVRYVPCFLGRASVGCCTVQRRTEVSALFRRASA